MFNLDIIIALFIVESIMLGLPIILVIKLHSIAKKHNYENELSKEILDHFNNENTPSLTDMVDFHRNSEEIIKYKLEE